MHLTSSQRISNCLLHLWYDRSISFCLLGDASNMYVKLTIRKENLPLQWFRRLLVKFCLVFNMNFLTLLCYHSAVHIRYRYAGVQKFLPKCPSCYRVQFRLFAIKIAILATLNPSIYDDWLTMWSIRCPISLLSSLAYLIKYFINHVGLWYSNTRVVYWCINIFSTSP